MVICVLSEARKTLSSWRAGREAVVVPYAGDMLYNQDHFIRVKECNTLDLLGEAGLSNNSLSIL